MKHMSLMLKKELEYKISFILSFISQIGIFFSYYFMTIALFQKFDNIIKIYEVFNEYIKSNTLATGLSNALRVDICNQEETLTNGNNNT